MNNYCKMISFRLGRDSNKLENVFLGILLCFKDNFFHINEFYKHSSHLV
jgi:hypothetical protein